MEAVVGPDHWQPESCVDYIPEESPAKLTRNLTILITNESVFILSEYFTLIQSWARRGNYYSSLLFVEWILNPYWFTGIWCDYYMLHNVKWNYYYDSEEHITFGRVCYIIYVFTQASVSCRELLTKTWYCQHERLAIININIWIGFFIYFIRRQRCVYSRRGYKGRYTWGLYIVPIVRLEESLLWGRFPLCLARSGHSCINMFWNLRGAQHL